LIKDTLVADPFSITPENVVEVPSLPVVSTGVLDPLELLIVPPPAIDPTVGLKLNRSKTAPPLTVNAVDVGNALLAPNCKVPPLTVVVPIYVFTLLRINVPEPLLVKLPPVITPDTCPSFNPTVVAVLVVLIVISPVVTPIAL
jgi:hypothetical protein